MHTNSHWRLCSTCKSEIMFGQRYWTCSVSTCNRAQAALVFCSLPCWESHVPMMRHRDAWADERRAPGRHAQETERPHPTPAAATSSRPPAGERVATNEAAATGERVAVSEEAAAAGALPRRRLIVKQTLEPGGASSCGSVEGSGPAGANASAGLPRDILIVASKMKSYIKARSGMNTSDRVLEPLSDKVRELCDDAIDRARAEGRKTVLDRDFYWHCA